VGGRGTFEREFHIITVVHDDSAGSFRHARVAQAVRNADAPARNARTNQPSRNAPG